MTHLMQAMIDLIVLMACLSVYLTFTILARKGSWFAVAMVLVTLLALFIARSTSASRSLAEHMPIVFSTFTIPLIFGGREERLASVILIGEFVVVALLRLFVPVVLSHFDTGGALVDVVVLSLLTIGAQRYQSWTLMFCAALYLVQVVGHMLMLIGPNLPEHVYFIYRTAALPIIAFALPIFCLPHILRIWRLRVLDTKPAATGRKNPLEGVGL